MTASFTFERRLRTRAGAAIMNKRCATLLTLSHGTGLSCYADTARATPGRPAGARRLRRNWHWPIPRDVVHRSDATANQVSTSAAFTQLQDEARRSGPCSPPSLALMKKIDVESSYIRKTIGHTSGTHMDCSSGDCAWASVAGNRSGGSRRTNAAGDEASVQQ